MGGGGPGGTSLSSSAEDGTHGSTLGYMTKKNPIH